MALNPGVGEMSPITPKDAAPVKHRIGSVAWWGEKFHRNSKRENTQPPKQSPEFDLDKLVTSDGRGVLSIDRNGVAHGMTVAYGAIREGFNENHAPEKTDAILGEHIQPHDPRYFDPTIPDFLKVGTDAYAVRQIRGGNHLDANVLHQALVAVGHLTHPMPGEKGLEWYNEALIPAIDRLLWTGRINRVADIKAPTPETPVNEKGLTQAVQEFLATEVPHSLIERALQYADFDNQLPTVGRMLQQLAKDMPEAFQIMLAKTMARGFEGYSLAEALAKNAYSAQETNHLPPTDGTVGFDSWKKLQEIEHPEQYHLPPIQKDIAIAVDNLLNFPLSLIDGKMDLDKTATQIGNIFAKASDEDRMHLMTFMQYSKVARLIAFDAVHFQPKPTESTQHKDTDEEAWRKVQGNYPISPRLLEQAKNYADTRKTK